jgi:hypothetical protein
LVLTKCLKTAEKISAMPFQPLPYLKPLRLQEAVFVGKNGEQASLQY